MKEKKRSNNKIKIFDTTLRDGEQSPGSMLDTQEKLTIAKELEKLNVDVIEAGFPASSPVDFKSVDLISQRIKNCIICGLSRALPGDIDVAVKALKKAVSPRIHTGIGVSDIHIKYKFKTTREDVMNRAVKAVQYAKRFINDIEFYAEDAGRADRKYLIQVIRSVIKAGATVINIPDTTGYCLPSEYGALIAFLIKEVPELEDVTLSVHCHNDLGLATANTLYGIMNGARQVEVTVNGIGERAGNASLEEIVMIIDSKKNQLPYYTSIEKNRIGPVSAIVSRMMGIPVQPNKAIVGRNAFLHSSGIHQDGILKDRSTYEIIDPVSVGVGKSNFILTARSGRAAIRYEALLLGFRLSNKELNDFYPAYLKLADRQKEITLDQLRKLLTAFLSINA